MIVDRINSADFRSRVIWKITVIEGKAEGKRYEHRRVQTINANFAPRCWPIQLPSYPITKFSIALRSPNQEHRFVIDAIGFTRLAQAQVLFDSVA